MIGVLLKELRENAKWAGAIFAAIGLFGYSLIRRRNPDLLFALGDAPMMVFAPLAGLLMGVVQTLFETRPDNWAFVVHRPVWRRRIFAAKSAAGLLLLYAALELPCLLMAAWAARPGNLQMPFQARMLLPGLAVALNAGCYYFAGMILTLRKARWLGTRLLPLGLAIGCSLAVWLAAEFWQALLFIVAGHCVGAVAAWGVFASAGAADRGVAPRAALGLMIHAGVLAIGLGLVGALGIFQTTSTWSWWRLDNRGNVLRVTTTLHNNERSSTVTDSSGRRVPEYDGVDLDNPAYADCFARFHGPLIDDRLVGWPASTMLYRGSYRTPLPGVIRLRTVAKAGARLRAGFLFDVQRRIIDEYDPTSRVMIGTIGPAGFMPARAAPRERFPGGPLNPSAQGGTHTLAFDSIVYWMELDHRRVRPLFVPRPDDPVVSAIELPPLADPTVLIATRTRLHVLRPSGELLSTAELESDLSQCYFLAAILPSNHHLALWRGPLSPTQTPHPVFTEFSSGAQAKVIRRIETPRFKYRAAMEAPRTALLGLIYPPGLLPLYRAWFFNWIFDMGPQKWWLFHGWMFGSGLLCACVTYLLGRRYGFGMGKLIAWSLANLLLGPGGLVAMLGLNELPAREACGACGGRRLAGRQTCPHCSVALPSPDLDGREIFEPAEGSAGAAAGAAAAFA